MRRGGPGWAAVKRIVWERAGGRCERCGRKFEPVLKAKTARDGHEYQVQVHPGFEYDHVREIADGGALLDPENVQLLCAGREGSCHWLKTRLFGAARRSAGFTSKRRGDHGFTTSPQAS
ncbi:MAG: HNH endonuclease [Euryarchaeota archaeon]|nr:HNH endonuclease [Euryarchaeota archaeon]MDE1836518.1 HNH endonuclease [Euryarchaeota archaeon]MDE1879287.1 HNH endonuclease [Euryarchaeota archaeon]MDE2044488.1 HNH endonuclease [Thermoplasmata archaeon]